MCKGINYFGSQPTRLAMSLVDMKCWGGRINGWESRWKTLLFFFFIFVQKVDYWTSTNDSSIYVLRCINTSSDGSHMAPVLQHKINWDSSISRNLKDYIDLAEITFKVRVNKLPVKNKTKWNVHFLGLLGSPLYWWWYAIVKHKGLKWNLHCIVQTTADLI